MERVSGAAHHWRQTIMRDLCCHAALKNYKLITSGTCFMKECGLKCQTFMHSCLSKIVSPPICLSAWVFSPLPLVIQCSAALGAAFSLPVSRACLGLIPRNFGVKCISQNYFISRQMGSVDFPTRQDWSHC